VIPKVIQPAAKHYPVLRPAAQQYKDVTPGRSMAAALGARRPVSLPVLRQSGPTGASGCPCPSGGGCSCPGKGSAQCSSRGGCCTGLNEHRNALPHVPVQARAAARGRDPRLATFPGVPYGSPDAIVPLHYTGMRCLSWTRVLYRGRHALFAVVDRGAGVVLVDARGDGSASEPLVPDGLLPEAAQWTVGPAVCTGRTGLEERILLAYKSWSTDEIALGFLRREHGGRWRFTRTGAVRLQGPTPHRPQSIAYNVAATFDPLRGQWILAWMNQEHPGGWQLQLARMRWDGTPLAAGPFVALWEGSDPPTPGLWCHTTRARTRCWRRSSTI